MIERYVKNEKIRILYEAKQLKTGLTDVTINIIDENGNKIVDSASMTELSPTNAPGVYYYDWYANLTGTFTIYCDSASYPRTMIDTVIVIDKQSKYKRVLGAQGGSVSRVTVRDTWTEKEKQKFIESMEKIAEQQEKINDKISAFEKQLESIKYEMQNNKNSILEMKDRYDQNKSSTNSTILMLHKKIIDLDKDINDKINELYNLQQNKIDDLISNFNTKVKTLNEDINLIKQEYKQDYNVLKTELLKNLKDLNSESFDNLQKIIHLNNKNYDNSLNKLMISILKLYPSIQKIKELQDDLEKLN